MILEEKVSELEAMVTKLAYIQMNTQMQIDKMAQDNKISLDKMTQDNKISLDKMTQDTRDLKKQMNQRYEELVKKLGTIAEDMVIPNINGIAKRYFNCSQSNIDISSRRWKTKPLNPAEGREFDVIAVYTDIIIIVETKHNPRTEYAKEFMEFLRDNNIFDYFPEYAGKKLIPIFASFHIPDNVKQFLTKNKIYGMEMKEDTMDLINFEDIK